MERRLTTIVAADIVGFSRLVGLDEEGTLAAQRAHWTELVNPLIEEHGGRIANTAGDSMLIEFPSAVLAVRCAVAVQDGMASRNADVPEERRITYRVGINIGDVVAQGQGNDADLLGDGVNIAARLEALAPPGGIVVSRNVRDQIRDRDEVMLADLGEVEVKNIARPVRIFQVVRDGEAAMSLPRTPRRRWLWVAATAVVLIAMLAGGWRWYSQRPEFEPANAANFAYPLPEKPSIAVLAFDNLSGDPAQDYFVDGFAEDLTTNLAQSNDIFVAARNSALAYRGKPLKVGEVAEQLGVRYVLGGSVRRLGGDIRITVQLIDASKGVHAWAKRYDEPADRLFDLQDELTREIAGTLLANINRADLARLKQKRPSELSAHDYVLQARARYALKSRAAIMEARALAESAIAVDPEYAPAYAILGDTLNSAYILQWDGPEALDRAYEAARRAVSLDPHLSDAHELLGRVLLRRGQHDEAILSLTRAIELNPNRADNYASLADTLTFAGRPGEAIALLDQAIRLDPFYSPRYDMYFGRAYFFAGEFDPAIQALKKCSLRAPTFRACQMYLAPAYSEAGQDAEARRSVEALLELAPQFSISNSVVGHLPFVPKVLDAYVEALRKAGVPE